MIPAHIRSIHSAAKRLTWALAVLEALWFSVDWRILTVQGICNFQVSETSQSGWWFQHLWKIWKSVGMMKFPTYGKTIQMCQTANQQWSLSKNCTLANNNHLSARTDFINLDNWITLVLWNLSKPLQNLPHRYPRYPVPQVDHGNHISTGYPWLENRPGCSTSINIINSSSEFQGTSRSRGVGEKSHFSKLDLRWRVAPGATLNPWPAAGGNVRTALVVGWVVSWEIYGKNMGNIWEKLWFMGNIWEIYGNGMLFPHFHRSASHLACGWKKMTSILYLHCPHHMFCWVVWIYPKKNWLWGQKKLKKMVLSENSVPPKLIVCSICSMKIRWSQMTNWGYPHFQTTLISKTPSSVWKSSDCLHLSASNRSRLSSTMLFHVVEVS